MKLKLSAALVAGAFAGLAATSAQAGVLQASFKVFAAEVFGSSAVSLKVPVISYNLSRPLSGTAANPNNFTVTLTLLAGTWTTAPNATLDTSPTTAPISASSATIGTNSAGQSTVTYAFSVANGVTYPVNSTITFGGATDGFANGLNTALSAPMANACSPQQANVDATIKMTNASGVEFDTNDPGADTQETLFASNVALKVDGQASSAFTPVKELSVVDVFIPSLSTKFTTPADVTGANTMINLGSVRLEDRGPFFDTDGLANYSLGTAPGAFSGTIGHVDASTLALVVTGKLSATGALGLFTDTACALPVVGAGGVGTTNAARDSTSFTYTATYADFGFAGAVGASKGRIFVCYTVPGNEIIPTTPFNLTGTALNKTAGSNEVPDPVCPSALYNLGANGVQVDVRNWIHPAQATASGWTSVIRIINPSDTQTITVNGQTINSDGTLGATGTIVTLPPRAAKFFSSAQIGAALTSGTLPAADGNNARLRLTANGSSLRVQNYTFNAANSNFFEASSAQGDDGFTDPTLGTQKLDIPAQNNK